MKDTQLYVDARPIIGMVRIQDVDNDDHLLYLTPKQARELSCKLIIAAEELEDMEKQ